MLDIFEPPNAHAPQLSGLGKSTLFHASVPTRWRNWQEAVGVLRRATDVRR